MRKSQQVNSRKRSAKINRLNMQNRRLRRWWQATIVAPLARKRENSRAARRRRLMAMPDPSFRKPPAMDRRSVRRRMMQAARDRRITFLKTPSPAAMVLDGLAAAAIEASLIPTSLMGRRT